MIDTCTAIRRDGQACTARALPNSPYCWAHDPALGEQRRAKRAEGGHNKGTARRLERRMPSSLKPVLDALYGALTGLEDETVDPKTATAMASVGSAIARIYETAEMDARLGALEAQAGQRRTR